MKTPYVNLIPELTKEEFELLEKSCIKEGIREALLIWSDTLLDGHNRYKIALKHNLKYETKQIDSKIVFDDTSARIWILTNQLSRRNLSNYQRSVIALQLEELLKPKAKANQRTSTGGAKPQLKQKSAEAEPPIETRKEIAKSANVSHDTISKVKVIQKSATPEIIAKVEAGDISINQAYQKTKQIVIKEKYANKEIPFPTDKYRVIYADPPWNYGNTMPIGSTNAKDYYPTMPLQKICDLPIKDMVADDAVLFLWVTSPLLEESFQVIKAWGFKYKSSFIWDKVKHNMGFYNSVRHEFLLICTKGSCVPENKKLFDSVQVIERTEHSKKPEGFRDIIDTIYPNGKRIELFARTKAKDNWEVWGNEL